MIVRSGPVSEGRRRDMRYTEPREQSAEWLRAALTKMGQHDAAFNPVTFAVWYEVVAGTNRRLTAALQQAAKTDPRLGDATMRQLHQRHIMSVEDAELTRLSTEFERVMETVAQSAEHTRPPAMRRMSTPYRRGCRPGSATR